MTKLLLPRGYRNTELLHNRLHTEPESAWLKRGQTNALRLFHAMAERVPAYKDFLRKQRFSPASVRTISDFKNVPLIDKDNYLRKYPKQMLCWDGEFSHGQWVISTTSGSSGQPYYFPRQHSQDWQYAVTAELYLRNNFRIQDKSTLYIVAFPMGAWIGGLFTYEALKLVADHGGYDLSIITPGIHKQEIINAVLQLSGNFDQVIIGAYAPFLKDILEDGEKAGIDWKKINVRFVFSAEAFTENFRDFVLEKVGSKNIYMDTLNHYGTVDLGTMAHETPLSIFLRRRLFSEGNASWLLPESTREPTVCQYDPSLFYFEEQNRNLVCSAFSGLPLVRYDLKDYGGVFTLKHAQEVFKFNQADLLEEFKSEGLDETRWNLPFVYVYERDDFTASYYAFLVYPDTIRRALIAKKWHGKITGKFSMEVVYNDEGRQKLNIHTELRKEIDMTKQLIDDLKEDIHESLMQHSTEYPELFKSIGDEAKPEIYLWEYESPTYFRPGAKQKWVIK